MANVTIPNLTSATSITPSTDLLVVEQTAGTRKATPSQLFTDSATQNSGLGITSGGVYTIRKNLKDNICTDNETLNSASSKQYDAGKYFFNTGTDTLRKATSTINAGAIITSSNSSETTVADELSQINTDLSANSSGAVTNMVWANQHINSLSKNGNVVTAIFGGYMSTPISVTDDTVLCKIPEGYRPKREIFCSGFRATTSSGTREFGIFRITANGEVHSQTGTQLTIGVMRVFGSWGV